MHPWERCQEIDLSRIGELQKPALRSREAVASPGEFLQKACDGSGEIPQCRRVGVTQLAESFGRRLTKRPPGAFRQRILCLADTLARLEKGGQLVGRELAESLECGMTGKRSDADQGHHLRGRNVLSDPRQELNEIELIEEVVLKPQDQLIV